MDLSPAQFHEHLNEFRDRLGLEFHPNMIEFAGKSYPTVNQRVILSGIAGNEPGRHLRATVATEQGRLHTLGAYLPAGRENNKLFDRLDFDYDKSVGEDYALHMPRAPHEVTSPARLRAGLRDPMRFHEHVQGIMNREAETRSTPHGLLLELNKEILSEFAPASGKISVEHSVYPNIRDTRWYHFHTGAGTLEKVPPPKSWAERFGPGG